MNKRSLIIIGRTKREHDEAVTPKVAAHIFKKGNPYYPSSVPSSERHTDHSSAPSILTSPPKRNSSSQTSTAPSAVTSKQPITRKKISAPSSSPTTTAEKVGNRNNAPTAVANIYYEEKASPAYKEEQERTAAPSQPASVFPSIMTPTDETKRRKNQQEQQGQ
mmetsp:Transcript_45277/g.52257  ORF Transcript_45277/g.52257 Transcript_45277/m.52257 type:complete len:163 (+) Transcript_45277:586-1074(+)